MICIVDPASKNAAFTLWSIDGSLLHVCALISSQKIWGARLSEMQLQIVSFFSEEGLNLSDVSLFLIEDVRSRVVGLVGGAYLSLFHYAEFSEKKSLIAVSSWKAFIRNKTGEKDPKGFNSLKKYIKETKSKVKVESKWSEDICDSIMMGLYYFSKQEIANGRNNKRNIKSNKK